VTGRGAVVGHRLHREPGEPIAGHHADRPAGGSPAWRPDHDYTHRGNPAQLPAWYFQLHRMPVPDDAPRTPPPARFAALMARRRTAARDPLRGGEMDGG
jgi:hypothetical protein